MKTVRISAVPQDRWRFGPQQIVKRRNPELSATVVCRCSWHHC